MNTTRQQLSAALTQSGLTLNTQGSPRRYQLARKTNDAGGQHALTGWTDARTALAWLNGYNNGQRNAELETEAQNRALDNLLDFYATEGYEPWKTRRDILAIINGDADTLETWKAEALAADGYRNGMNGDPDAPHNGWHKASE